MKKRPFQTELYGKTLRQKKVAAFTLTERFYPPFFKTPVHSHESALFCLVLRGNYTESFGRRERICAPSTALFHASQDPHAEHFHDRGGHSFIVEINSQWMARIRREIKFPDITADFPGGRLPRLGMKLYREFQHLDSLSPLIIEGLMLEITGETARMNSKPSNDRKPDWLKRVESYLLERFAEPFSLDEVARFVGVHPVHLAQSYRKFNRITVGHRLRSIRLENARRLLIQTRKPISEIALETGFSDQSHLTRLFKREYGLTPHRYRKNFG
ncbi:MAG: AraC family transcriptional regulator [Pyrinomonadaceae bacterium]